MKMFYAESLSDVVFIMLINVKIVGILTFMSRINSAKLSMKKSFITSGPGFPLLSRLDSRYCSANVRL